eukprot:scaffold928_cov370-Prasinococcus_capsulatus_cf.AAC.5
MAGAITAARRALISRPARALNEALMLVCACHTVRRQQGRQAVAGGDAVQAGRVLQNSPRGR